MVLAPWLSINVISTKNTERPVANDKNTTAVFFLSFFNCLQAIFFNTWPLFVRCAFRLDVTVRYPSASIGVTAQAILTGFLLPSSRVMTAIRIVKRIIPGWNATTTFSRMPRERTTSGIMKNEVSTPANSPPPIPNIPIQHIWRFIRFFTCVPVIPTVWSKP